MSIWNRLGSHLGPHFGLVASLQLDEVAQALMDPPWIRWPWDVSSPSENHLCFGILGLPSFLNICPIQDGFSKMAAGNAYA